MGNYFAKNLKFIREQKTLSKSDLSKKLNVSQSTISRWENEEMGITLDKLFDLSHILNISMADLTGKDLSQETLNNELDEYAILFDKYKDLEQNDKELIKNIIETRKKQIDEQLGESE